MRVSIVSPSGVVPGAELDAGLGRLGSAGFEPVVEAGVDRLSFVFAGSDPERAGQFWDAAWRGDTQVVWCARGGYGAARILPELERRTLEQGTPPVKLLCGYSDITALHEFVRSRWGWPTLHCAMPTGNTFLTSTNGDFEATAAFVRGGWRTALPAWRGRVLTATGPGEPLIDLAGTLVGGNLTVIASLVGTPFAVDNSGGRLLFIEDVGEAPYRIDRMLNQLWQAGVFRGVRALLLGTFEGCEDAPPTTGPDRRPTRPKLSEAEWMREIFAEFSARTRVPVLTGLPVGHGAEQAPLPLGAKYVLRGTGVLELTDWDWGTATGQTGSE